MVIAHCKKCKKAFETINPAYRPADRIGATLDVGDKIALLSLVVKESKVEIDVKLYFVIGLQASLFEGCGVVTLEPCFTEAVEPPPLELPYNFHRYMTDILKVSTD